MMADHLAKEGASKAKEDSNIVVFRKYHENAYANTYAALNKTSKEVAVKLDMTSSRG